LRDLTNHPTAFTAGQDGDELGLTVLGYADDVVTLKFGSNYGSFYRSRKYVLNAGDQFFLQIHDGVCNGVIEFGTPLDCSAPAQDSCGPPNTSQFFQQFDMAGDYGRCNRHMAAALAASGFTVGDSGDGWAMGSKDVAIGVTMLCNAGDRRRTHVVIFTSAPKPDNLVAETERLKQEMLSRFR
jgi:hypothetical protein